MRIAETKGHLMGFIYAERLKSALIIAGRLLDVLADLEREERSGGLKMFGSFFRGVRGEMRLAANVMRAHNWNGISAKLNLIEGYARLGQMEAARQELSRSLSLVTTLSSRAMNSLQTLGLI